MFGNEKNVFRVLGDKYQVVRQNNFKLPKDSRIGIVMASYSPIQSDIPFDEIKKTSDLEFSALSAFFPEVRLLNDQSSREHIFSLAEQENIQFIFFSQIEVLSGFKNKIPPACLNKKEKYESVRGVSRYYDRPNCRHSSDFSVLRDIKLTLWLYDVSSRQLRETSFLSFRGLALKDTSLSETNYLFVLFKDWAHSYFPN